MPERFAGSWRRHRNIQMGIYLKGRLHARLPVTETRFACPSIQISTQSAEHDSGLHMQSMIGDVLMENKGLIALSQRSGCLAGLD